MRRARTPNRSTRPRRQRAVALDLHDGPADTAAAAEVAEAPAGAVVRLTSPQRAAIGRLRRCESLDNGWGVICRATGEDGIYDGQAFVNWRTVRALQRRGLVEADWDDERVRLTSLGRSEP